MDLYKESHKKLEEALKNNAVTKFCYDDTNWKDFGQPGNRCKLYCETNSACKKYFSSKGMKHKYL